MRGEPRPRSSSRRFLRGQHPGVRDDHVPIDLVAGVELLDDRMIVVRVVVMWVQRLIAPTHFPVERSEGRITQRRGWL